MNRIRNLKQMKENAVVVSEPACQWDIIKRSSLPIKTMPVIKDSVTASNYARLFYKDDIYLRESFFMITMNRANSVTGYYKVSTGGVSGTVVDPKLVMFVAINSLSTGIVLVHNHPSGCLTPSQPDIDLTKRLKEGLKLMDVFLTDHIILTPDSYFSFADSGKL